MAQDHDNGFTIASLTKPKGVMVAAPIVIAAALLISVVMGGEKSIARDDASSPSNASGAVISKRSVHAGSAEKRAAEAPAAGVGGLIQLAAADKPAKGSFSDAQEKEIGDIVRRYLLQNPEVLIEVSAELEKRRKVEQESSQAKVLVDEKKEIFRSPHDFVLGDTNGDITVVEFFDYNCGWCKRAYDEVMKLTADDKKVRVVMKEFPIFGDDSRFAAKAAMASMKQNKYWEFHTAMMKARKVTTQNAMEIAKSVGIDVAALKSEMEKPIYDQAIEENTRIAQALGMQGTPGFIVDAKVNYGYVPASGLKEMLAEIRKEGCKIC